ncbi:hypothetical protein [Parapedobacter tibetensis]|uniref:hypothetical protein n=1 Tax=Parapedobacter tibetensis TaxID=2972951 RepID=UPI00214DAF80|nr:hypothetical protein [Parapedobacter tibetensis]
MTTEKLPQVRENRGKIAGEDKRKLLNLIAEIIVKIIMWEVNESNRLRQNQ